MRTFLDALKNIYENGVDRSDRTGVGRRGIFGMQMRFDLTGNKLPLLTTRKLFTRGILEELKWFLRGSTNNLKLSEKNVHIWDGWAVEEKHIVAFIAKYFKDEDEAPRQLLKQELSDRFLGSIGNLYGKSWRYAPNDFNAMWPDCPVSDIASDKLAAMQTAYKQLKEADENAPAFELLASHLSYKVIDQMQELLLNLRKRPYSARHVVSGWIPQWIPFEDLTPQENVLLGKSALAPCHVLQQYFVYPEKVPGGKKRISLQMYQR